MKGRSSLPATTQRIICLFLQVAQVWHCEQQTNLEKGNSYCGSDQRQEKTHVVCKKRQSKLKKMTIFNPLGISPPPPPCTPAPFAFSWDFGRSPGRNETRYTERRAAMGSRGGEVRTHLQITQPNKPLRELTPRLIHSMNQ